MLWEKLRDGRLLGLKFRRQHPVKSYVLDFYCRELQFAIEIDGGVHEDPGQQARDRERQQFLEGLGIRFARVATEDVESNRDAVVQRLRSTIQPLLPSTRPP